MRWGVLWLVLCSGCEALYPFDEFRFDRQPDGGDGAPVEASADAGELVDLAAVDLAVMDSNDGDGAPAEASADVVATVDAPVDGGPVDAPAVDTPTVDTGVDPCSRCGPEERCAAGACVPRVTLLATASVRTCAVRDGAVWCWGVGNGGVSVLRPEHLADLDGATSLAVGSGRTCVVRAGGAWCRRLGSAFVAVALPPLPGVVQVIESGSEDVYGVDTSGAVWRWSLIANDDFMPPARLALGPARDAGAFGHLQLCVRRRERRGRVRCCARRGDRGREPAGDIPTRERLCSGGERRGGVLGAQRSRAARGRHHDGPRDGGAGGLVIKA